MTALYNEIEPYPAQWLRNLVGAGHIARGEVNERSIKELTAADVGGSAQFHAFAGVGVWSYALRLAGWPDDAPIWTGSCPCQPFSSAGKGRGTEDERHLWPVWRGLIAECRPPVLFGEQVASPAGRRWFSAVRADLEELGYAVGAADLCAAGVGAPHIRQRIFFGARLADANSIAGHQRSAISGGRDTRSDALTGSRPRGDGNTGWLGDTYCERAGRHAGAGSGSQAEGTKEGQSIGRIGDMPSAPGADGWMGDTSSERLKGSGVQLRQRRQKQEVPATPWAGAHYLECSDGKSRPAQPGIHPLADGAATRVGRLRAYGNAIVPQVAAAFVTAFEKAWVVD